MYLTSLSYQRHLSINGWNKTFVVLLSSCVFVEVICIKVVHKNFWTYA